MNVDVTNLMKVLNELKPENEIEQIVENVINSFVLTPKQELNVKNNVCYFMSLLNKQLINELKKVINKSCSERNRQITYDKMFELLIQNINEARNT